MTGHIGRDKHTQKKDWKAPFSGLSSVIFYLSYRFYLFIIEYLRITGKTEGYSVTATAGPKYLILKKRPMSSD